MTLPTSLQPVLDQPNPSATKLIPAIPATRRCGPAAASATAPPEPVLRFSPAAWAKLVFLCHLGPTEIGGFGISDPADLLYIQDFQIVHQVVSPVSVAFDDLAVADFYEQQVDSGRTPQEFSRIWIHTHPGISPEPSSTDEETFARVFGGCDWAVMAILARGGRTYARLRFNAGPGGALLIPVEVDYRRDFAASDQEAWVHAYSQHVHPWMPALEPSAMPEASKAGHGERGRVIEDVQASPHPLEDPASDLYWDPYATAY